MEDVIASSVSLGYSTNEEHAEQAPEEPVDEKTLAWRTKMLERPPKAGTQRWYFDSVDGVGTETASQKLNAPVSITGSTWVHFETKGILLPGAYVVVLCLTVKSDTNFGSLELSCGHKNGINTHVHVHPLVLKEIEGIEFQRLSLDIACETEDPENTGTIALYPVFRGVGSFQVHYFEIRPLDATPEPDDHLLYMFGQPRQSIHCWGEIERGVDMAKTRVSAKILAVRASRCWGHVATLSRTKGWLYVDIWKYDSSVLSHNTFSGTTTTTKTSIARKSIPWTKDIPDFEIGLSWNASKVAIFAIRESDSSKEHFPFTVLEMAPFVPADEKKTDGPRTLQQATGYSKFDFFKDFVGYAKFHVINEDQPVEDDELLMASNGESLAVYSVGREWTQLYSIVLSLKRMPFAARLMIEEARGDVFSWIGVDGVITLFDVKSGKEINHIPIGSGTGVETVCISKDKRFIATSVGNRVTLYFTDSGVEFRVFEETDGSISSIYFLRDSNQLLIGTYSSTDDLPVQYGKILDFPSLKLVDIFYMPFESGPETYNVLESGGEKVTFGALDSSRLDIVTLKDISLWPTTEVCDESCQGEQIEYHNIKEPGCIVVSGGGNGSTYRVETKKFQNATQRSVSIKTAGGLWKQVFFSSGKDSPDTPFGAHVHYCFFIPETARLVLCSLEVAALWSMPTTEDGQLELSALLKLPGELNPIQKFSACKHGKHCIFTVDSTLLNDPQHYIHLHLTSTDIYRNESTEMIVRGISKIYFYYIVVQEREKKAIVRYISQLLNLRLTAVNGDPDSVMAIICRRWSLEQRANVKGLLRAILFGEDSFRWAPFTDYTEDNNPIAILLKTAEEKPKVIGSVKVIIQYCLQRARDDNSGSFMKFILECLDGLIVHCPDVALTVLRSMAYMPSRMRSVVVKHHIVARPPAIRNLWKENNEPLTECVQPILQIQLLPPKEPDPKNYYFIQDLYEASFDMLWTRNPRRDKDGTIIPVKVLDAGFKATWFSTFYHLVLLHCNPQAHRHINAHEFELEYLNNPAIEALILYKWNTFGYASWLFRFVSQCIFYILVIIVTTMQVYYPEPEQLVGVFIAIIAMASIFIWLEYPQFRVHPGRYMTSPYNYLDLITFTLPATASIIQLVDIQSNHDQAATRCLSFSILFISIHLLFELRINKSVCKYVTIVVQVMGEIKVFFIVFAVSILTFALAILHMLRGRTVSRLRGEENPLEDVGFPSNFLKAISATYFMVGGRYDSIGNLFEQDDVAFHIMMMFYFFFTVILMLNVLVALINVAFNKGDETWRLVWMQNRLRYVESAENMSYHIPGFRQTHNYFPEKIYYTASHIEVREYMRKNAEMEEDGKAERPFKSKVANSHVAMVTATLKDALGSAALSKNSAAADDTKSIDVGAEDTRSDVVGAGAMKATVKDSSSSPLPQPTVSHSRMSSSDETTTKEKEVKTLEIRSTPLSSTVAEGYISDLQSPTDGAQTDTGQRVEQLQQTVEQLQQMVKDADLRAEDMQRQMLEMLMILRGNKQT